MTWSDVGDVAIRALVLGLVSGAVVQVIKSPIKAGLRWRGRFPAEGTPGRDTWRDAIRTLAVLVGGVFGLLDVWPAWSGWQTAWGPLLGLVGGMSSAALYDAWFRTVNGAPDTLLDTFRARFGGARARTGRRTRARQTPNPVDTRPDSKAISDRELEEEIARRVGEGE